MFIICFFVYYNIMFFCSKCLLYVFLFIIILCFFVVNVKYLFVCLLYMYIFFFCNGWGLVFRIYLFVYSSVFFFSKCLVFVCLFILNSWISFGGWFWSLSMDWVIRRWLIMRLIRLWIVCIRFWLLRRGCMRGLVKRCLMRKL